MAWYRQEERKREFDPKCVNITFHRRTGKGACFEFLCILKGKLEADKGTGFWLSYLDVQDSASTKAMLNSKNWRMADHFENYTDGEDVWDEDGDSADESYRARVRRRGVARKITAHPTRKPRKRQRTTTT